MIYLDHNATTPVLPEVLDAMLPYLREQFGNPSSGHPIGRAARVGVDRAREQVAALIGCEPDEVIFTSGGTEANNLAIRGLAEVTERRRIVTSTIEHPATARPVAWLERHGWQVTRLPVDSQGRVEWAPIPEDTALVTVMHANNETGVLQPIADLAERAHAVGAWMHTDAAQSAGKVPVDGLGVDLLSIAGHKLYAPKGVGALYVRRGVPIAPFVLGAGHERGLRPGTENVASIVGLGVACTIARREQDIMAVRVARLRDTLLACLMAEVPGLATNGRPGLPNTLNVRFPGVKGDAVLAGAPEVAASTGSACHEGVSTASDVILAMGVPAEEATGSVRLTLGRGTTEAEVELAATALARAWRAASAGARSIPATSERR